MTGLGSTSATRSQGFLAILPALLTLLFIVQVNGQYHIPLIQQIAWISAGLIVGPILMTVFTQRQLKYLARDNQVGTTVPVRMFLAVMGILAVFVVVGYGLVLFNLVVIEFEFFSSIGALATTGFLARYVLFRRYEKKKKMYIIQYWLRAGFFAVPQSNTKSTVNEGVALENGSSNK
jgi:hypothetical protein